MVSTVTAVSFVSFRNLCLLLLFNCSFILPPTSALIRAPFPLFGSVFGRSYCRNSPNDNNGDMEVKRILVTGANAGIGLALTKQLVADYGCHVYLGSRDAVRGANAVDEVKKFSAGKGGGSVELLTIDVSNEASVQAAAASLFHKLGSSMDDKNKLYAIVNNAGTGIAHGTSLAEILDTNVRGPRRVVDNFLPLLDPKVGRIVNVGSGAAPSFVSSMLTTKREKTQYVSPMDREEIEEEILKVERMNDDYAAYAGSKALLACYTMSLAREHPNLSIAILTPGYIKTNMTKGYGATKSPCEGTVALRKCLFDDLTGKSGYFWGSDGLRSPLHYLRNPGEPEYDSEAPTF